MLDKLKDSLRERTERNAVKSTLSYIKGGETITEDVIFKRSLIPIVGDWGRIYPVITEKNHIHFINLIFGGWKNFFKLVILFGIILLAFYGFYEVTTSCRELLKDNFIISKDNFGTFNDLALRNNQDLSKFILNTSNLGG
jgi:hypothetical protein